MLPFDPETVVGRLFLKIFKDQHVLDPNKTYYNETNDNSPILEIVSFVFSETEVKFKVCLNSFREPERDEIPII